LFALNSASNTVHIPLLVPELPTLEALTPYLRRIDQRRWYSNFGPLVSELETRIAASFRQPGQLQMSHAVTVGNATAGIELALRALNLPRDSLVLVPALTFVATATAVLSAGLTPVVADVDSEQWLLTPEIALDAKARLPLRAVIPVATFGCAQDAAAWTRFHATTGLPVIIDAAAAFGNQLDPGPTCAIFSLHATKPLAAGEGGVVVTHDAAFAATIRQLSNFGIDLSGEAGVPVGSTTLVGTNAKMSEYHAAVGLASLDVWPQTAAQRRALFARYSAVLAASCGARLQWQQMSDDAVRSVCCVLLKSASHRDRAEAVMAERGIATRRWYLPLINQHPAFQHIDHLPAPCADDLAQRLLGIPFHVSLSEQDMSEIAEVLSAIA
jgi:dTDP-4-amino-4,6-dideoxygalactose transaminase